MRASGCRDVGMRDVAAIAAFVMVGGCTMESPEGSGLVGPTLDDPPPPISGGSLLVTNDDRFAVAADPDRDVVHVVQLDDIGLVRSFDFAQGDEPGRVVEGPDGRVHVVLRGGAGIASIDPSGVSPPAEIAVCDSPRGIDVTREGIVIVACAGGELVRVDEGETTTIARLEPDVRDVVVLGEHLLVSRFRRADVTVLDRDGEVVRTMRPERRAPRRDDEHEARVDDEVVAEGASDDGAPREPNTAFRLRRHGDRAFLLAQRSPVVVPGAGGGGGAAYGGGGAAGAASASEVASGPSEVVARTSDVVLAGAPVVETIVAEVHPDHIGPPFVARDVVLGVDVAVDCARSQVAIAVPSEIGGDESQRTRRILAGTLLAGSSTVLPSLEPPAIDGQPTAVAFTSDGRLVALSREPSSLYVAGESVPLSSVSRRDGGHDLFHVRSGTMACASCHPEAGDDGQVWNEDGTPRRTRALRGGLLETLPFHAAGDVADMEAILARRMPALAERAAHADAVSFWLDALAPATPPFVDDPGPAARGAELFESHRCATCHALPLGTSPGRHDVGTGGPREVPWLLELAFRAPYMANGCARTIEEALVPPCGGAAHGALGELGPRERSDLAAFLATW